MPENAKNSFSAEDFAFIKTWTEINRQALPPPIIKALTFIVLVYQDLESVKRKATDLVRQLRIAMGILPGSERGSRDGSGLKR